MELSGEIERMKKLTDMTNKIESLRLEMDNLILSRKALMNEYLNASLTNHLVNTEDTPPSR